MKLNDNTTTFDNTTSVVFSDNVTFINDRLFTGTKKLTSITIGNGVTTIGNAAFHDCGDDEGVYELVLTLGRNVTTINDEAFRSCEALKTLTLPATLKSIGNYAFESAGIYSLVIPAAAESLGERTFGSCGNLASIRIENSNKELKMHNGYYGTQRGREVHLLGTKPEVRQRR